MVNIPFSLSSAHVFKNFTAVLSWFSPILRLIKRGKWGLSKTNHPPGSTRARLNHPCIRAPTGSNPFDSDGGIFLVGVPRFSRRGGSRNFQTRSQIKVGGTTPS
ncbi:MAG: hypothetical protein CM15mV29_0980 [uncultured marine virus]|nr:MAG: hypothetical protein CM15mV29_0980 [uncultured marine virus]